VLVTIDVERPPLYKPILLPVALVLCAVKSYHCLPTVAREERIGTEGYLWPPLPLSLVRLPEHKADHTQRGSSEATYQVTETLRQGSQY
jgi:hypothetical protein